MVAYNYKDPLAPQNQIGGCAILSRDQAAHRVCKYGTDQTGMGRWAWTRYAGAGGVHLRIVVGYRPNHRGGKGSVFNQQERLLLKEDNLCNPRQAFWDNLRQDLKQWKEKGDQLIVMLDANDNIRSQAVTKELEDSELNLYNVHLLEHGLDTPPTHADGSNPINGIWATRGLSIDACGYRGIGWGMGGDHRLLWLDVNYVQAFGSVLPNVVRPPARRLKLCNPRVVKRYLVALKAFLIQHNVHRRVFDLERCAQFPPTELSIQELEHLDKLQTKTILYADRRCRGLKMGATPWSPELAALQNCIRLIRYLICCW